MKPTITTLPNGLRVVTHAMPHLETVSLGLWVGAGARHETRARARRLALPRAHGLQGHQAAQRAADRRGDRGGGRRAQRGDQPGDDRLLRPRPQGRRGRGAGPHRRHPAELRVRQARSSRASARSFCRRSPRRATAPTTSATTCCTTQPFPQQPVGRAILGTPDSVRRLHGGRSQGVPASAATAPQTW